MLLRTIKLLILTAVVLCFLAFAVVNREPIELSLFPFPIAATLPKFLLIISCFMFGLLVGGALMSLKSSKNKRLYKREHKRVVALENEIQGMKIHPISSANLPAERK